MFATRNMKPELKKRRGKFKVSASLWFDESNAVLTALHAMGIYLTQVQADYLADTVLCYGICAAFDELSIGDIAPEYTLLCEMKQGAPHYSIRKEG